jgi:hypothetical protein
MSKKVKEMWNKSNLCETFTVKPVTVDSWLRDGLPHTNAPKGRGHKIQIDPVELATWFTNKGMTKYLFMFPGLLKGVDKPNEALPRIGDSEQEFTSILGRARAVEKWLFEVWQKCPGEQVGMKAGFAEAHGKQLDNVRKLEMDWPNIQRKAGEVMPIADVSQQINRAVTVLKQDLLSIPQSVAPQCAGKKSGEISELIMVKIKETVRKLAKDLKQDE